MSRSFKYFVGVFLVLLLGGCLLAAADPYMQARQSVVMVRIEPDGGGGTGFITQGPASHPVTITNWHVCSPAKGGVLYLARQGEFSDMPRKVLGSDPTVDLCALEAAPGVSLPLGETPIKFQSLHVLGHPRMKIQTPSDGRYLGEEEEDIQFPSQEEVCPESFTSALNMFGILICTAHMVFGETTSRIFPGNSGSPVLNSRGQVVGVINASSPPDERGSFIPVRHLSKFLERF